MTFVWNPYTGQLDAVQSLLVLDERYIKKFPTGSTNLISVPTATTEALILKTTDDNTTKNLFETQKADNTVLTEISTAGKLTVRGTGASLVDFYRNTLLIGSISASNNDFNLAALGSGTGIFVFKSVGTESMRINEFRNVGINTGATVNAMLHIKGIRDGIQQIIQANSTQNANLTEWQDSSGNLLSAFNASGELGLTSAPVAGRSLQAVRAYTDTSGEVRLLNAQINANPGSTSTANYVGMAFTGATTDGNAQDMSGVIFGANIRGFHNADGTVGTMIGVATQIVLNSTSNGGVITNAIGLRVTAHANLGAGGSAITNNYGIFVQNQNVGDTLNYSIYTNAGAIRFGDNLIIETSGVTSQITSRSTANAFGPIIEGRKSRGSVASPSAVLSGDILFRFQAGGYLATGWSSQVNGDVMRAEATENWTDSVSGKKLVFSTIPNGSLSPTDRLTIGNDGNVLVQGFTSSTVGLTIKAASSQTANLTEWQDSSGNVLSGVDERGIPFADGDTDTGSLFIGDNAGNAAQSGIINVFIGKDSGKANTTGEGNVGLGKDALAVNTEGTSNMAVGQATMSRNTTGSTNSAIGRLALRFNITGSNNTAIGKSSGFGVENNSFSNNTMIGVNTGLALTTGSSNVLIGISAGSQLTTESNKLYIANSNTATPLILGDFTGNGGLTIHSQATTAVALTVKGIASQTANLTEWQDSSGGVMTKILAGGGIQTTQTLGVGTGVGTGDKVKIFNANTDSAVSQIGINLEIHNTHTDDAALSHIAFSAVSKGEAAVTKTLTEIDGFAGGATVKGDHAGTITNVNGLVSSVRLDSGAAGAVTTAQSLLLNMNSGGANTVAITTYRGIFLNNFSLNGGTIVNAYGIFLSDVNVGSSLNSAITTNAGNVALNIGADASTALIVGGATRQTNADFLQIESGWTFKESSVPTADAGYAKIWSQDNNELFFQSGDGAIHLLHGDAFSNMWFHSVNKDTVAISTANTFTLIDSFENVGEQDDLANAVANTTNNDITIGTNGGGKYKMTFHTSITSSGASSEMVIAMGVTLNTPIDVTGATNATPIVVTSVAHGLFNGDMVTITGGTTNTGVNGDWVVTAKTDDTFTLVDLSGSDSVGNGVYDASSGDVIIDYPGNLPMHRVVSQTDLGVGGSNADHNLLAGDKVKMYVANIGATRDLEIAIINLEIFRIGD